MVDVAPLVALRYATGSDPSGAAGGEEGAGRLSDLIAPPYDVITPEAREVLYARSPHNIVRVDLTRPEPGEAEDARYARARATLDDWRARGVLVREASPAFFVLVQRFTGPDGVPRTRTGFFSRARLSAFSEGTILPHERTLRGPKIDRLKLMRATRHSLSPVFGMYRDRDGTVRAILERASTRSPIGEATLDGVEHALFRLDDGAEVARLRALLAPARLYIADGHHRYETALAYRDERRAEVGERLRGIEGPPYESVLMFACPVEDPGMAIYPTHRLVSGLEAFDEGRLLATLAPFFAAEDAPADPAAAFRVLASRGADGPAFLMVTRSGRRILRLRPGAAVETVPAMALHRALRGLDVVVLHALVLEHGLGITPEAQAGQTHLAYAKDGVEALEAPVRDARVQAALLMNPTRIEEVLAVADAGEVLPQKSTYFYPKIPSGLLLAPLEG